MGNRIFRRITAALHHREMLAGCCLLAMCCSGRAAGQEPEVIVELSQPKIFEGDSVRYSVLLNHCERSAQPVMPTVAGVTFRLVSDNTFIQKTVISGFKKISVSGPLYEYAITPTQTGEVTIPSPTVVVDGKTYRGESVTLQVVPPGKQDLAILEVAVSRPRVYLLQPFQVRLKVAVKGLSEPHVDKDPLRGAGGVPALSIPWADDDSLPEGVEPDSPALRWLQSFVSKGRNPIGFSVNDVAARRTTQFGFGGMGSDPFSFLMDPQRVVFHPEPTRVKRKDANGRTVDYWEYTFERTLTATRLGTLSFGPVSLKGSLASQVNSAGEVMLEEVYAVAKPVTIEVHDAPTAGRPDSYIGAVGRFDVEAELSPTSVKVGDPMTFSLRIYGEGALNDATAPKIENTPAIADSFKVYEATEESTEGERKFKFNLRPKKPGIREFPPIEVAYFNFEKEKYVTLRTEPIKIEVAESDRLGNQDIAIAPTNPAHSPGAIETSTEGLFANITDPRRVYDERVRPETWFMSLGSMAGIFIVCALATRQLERRRNDPMLQRRRGAAKKAQAAIADARRLAAAGQIRESVEALSSGIIRFIADATGSRESGLTSRDVARELASVGVSADLIDRSQRLLDEFDAARYGGGDQKPEEQIRAADDLLTGLAREFRQRGLAV